MAETRLLTYDKLILAFSAVIQRPIKNSNQNFETLGALNVDEEIEIEMDGWNRQTVKLSKDETRQIELIEDDFANFVAFKSDDVVAVNLVDQTNPGFGEGPFGGGGFGGTGLGDVSSGIEGLFVAQGRFTDLQLQNLSTNEDENYETRLDIIAIKFKEEE